MEDAGAIGSSGAKTGNMSHHEVDLSRDSALLAKLKEIVRRLPYCYLRSHRQVGAVPRAERCAILYCFRIK